MYLYLNGFRWDLFTIIVNGLVVSSLELILDRRDMCGLITSITPLQWNHAPITTARAMVLKHIHMAKGFHQSLLRLSIKSSSHDIGRIFCWQWRFFYRKTTVIKFETDIITSLASLVARTSCDTVRRDIKYCYYCLIDNVITCWRPTDWYFYSVTVSSLVVQQIPRWDER